MKTKQPEQFNVCHILFENGVEGAIEYPESVEEKLYNELRHQMRCGGVFSPQCEIHIDVIMTILGNPVTNLNCAKIIAFS